jgi:putative tryptophan/tyrosine transport system substrate-binding protein
MLHLRRRQFIMLLGGATAAWPLAARAQQGERMHRIGVLMGVADDPEGQTRVAALKQGLQELGWTDGRNIQIEARFGGADTARIRADAAELVALAPDVIVGQTTPVIRVLRQATSSIPIIMAAVNDPVDQGFVSSLAHPGGNITGYVTGFSQFKYGLSGEWLELLKEVAPKVTRAAVIRDPAIASGIGQFGAIQAVAASLGVEVSPFNVRDAGEIERTITAFSHSSNGGLIVTGSALAVVYRELIIALAARNNLPAVYFERLFVTRGGLVSYGPDLLDQFRRAAGYVDRILRGEKPADLPVQAPTKYELVINLKTAKALGIEVPPTLLARADEVIE